MHSRHAWIAAPAAVTLAAWGVLALGAGGLAPPLLCAPMAPWILPSAASLDFVLTLDPPLLLATGWILMLAAMMPPLIVWPVGHLRDRSFAQRRGRATALFVVGYVAVWLLAGVVLEAAALLLQMTARGSLPAFVVAAVVAVLWQVSPAKQHCLNRCHSRPQLAAFGPAADREVLRFGLAHGAACVGACWALMLLPLLVATGHLIVMGAVALFLFAERLERPAPLGWRWRGPAKAVRIALEAARTWLAPSNRGAAP